VNRVVGLDPRGRRRPAHRRADHQPPVHDGKPRIGDNHNTPVFLRCYRRLGEFIPSSSMRVTAREWCSSTPACFSTGSVWWVRRTWSMPCERSPRPAVSRRTPPPARRGDQLLPLLGRRLWTDYGAEISRRATEIIIHDL